MSAEGALEAVHKVGADEQADLVEAVRQGRQIARTLEALPRQLGKQRWDEAVIRQVMEAGQG